MSSKNRAFTVDEVADIKAHLETLKARTPPRRKMGAREVVAEVRTLVNHLVKMGWDLEDIARELGQRDGPKLTPATLKAYLRAKRQRQKAGATHHAGAVV